MQPDATFLSPLLFHLFYSKLSRSSGWMSSRFPVCSFASLAYQAQRIDFLIGRLYQLQSHQLPLREQMRLALISNSDWTSTIPIPSIPLQVQTSSSHSASSMTWNSWIFLKTSAKFAPIAWTASPACLVEQRCCARSHGTNQRRRSQRKKGGTDYEGEGLSTPERKHVARIEKQWASDRQ